MIDLLLCRCHSSSHTFLVSNEFNFTIRWTGWIAFTRDDQTNELRSFSWTSLWSDRLSRSNSSWCCGTSVHHSWSITSNRSDSSIRSRTNFIEIRLDFIFHRDQFDLQLIENFIRSCTLLSSIQSRCRSLLIVQLKETEEDNALLFLFLSLSHFEEDLNLSRNIHQFSHSSTKPREKPMSLRKKRFSSVYPMRKINCWSFPEEIQSAMRSQLFRAERTTPLT